MTFVSLLVVLFSSSVLGVWPSNDVKLGSSSSSNSAGKLLLASSNRRLNSKFDH